MLGNKIKLLTITLLTLLSTVMLSAKDVHYTASVCDGGKYLFGCQVIEPSDGSGIYPFNVTADSTVYLHLLFGSPVMVRYEATVEPGQKYLFGSNQLFSATETPATSPLRDTLYLKNVAGCDSIVCLALHVKAQKPVMVRYEATVEPNQVYLFGCNPLSSATETAAASPLRDTLYLKSASGSDSIVCLALHVKAQKPVMVRYEATVEPNQVYLFGCNPLSSATETAAASPLRDTLYLKSASGSDSIVCLALHVKSKKTVMVRYEATIEPAQTYLFGCNPLGSADETSAADPIRDTLYLNCEGGGDSIVCLTLHVKKACQTVVTDTVAYFCEADLPVMWHGIAIGNDTTMCDDTIHNGIVGGCDSIVRLAAYIIRPTIYPEETVYVCDFNTPYNWRGKAYDQQGDYNDTVPSAAFNPLCADEIYTLHLRQYTAAEAPVTNASICKGATYNWYDPNDATRLIRTCTEAGEYGDTLYYKAGCDSIRFKLVLNVLDVKAEFSEDIYLCFGEKYEWKDGDRVIGTFDQTGVYHDTLPYISGCDSVRFTLNLTVGPEPTSTTMSDTTVYYGYDFYWFGKKYEITKDTLFTATEYDIHDCPSAYYSRKVKVKEIPVEHIDVIDTVCVGTVYSGAVRKVTVVSDTTWTDSVRVVEDKVPTDMFYHYAIFVYTTPEMLPETLIDSVRAVCGEYLHIEVADSLIRDYVKRDPDHQHFDPNVTIEWFIRKDGKWETPANVKLMGSDETATFKCVITDKCDKTLELTRTLAVVDPAVREIANILVQKYGHWLLMLHVNDLTRSEGENGYGYEFTEEDVDWYQIVDGVETKLDHHGYYYTADEELVGEFYAVINATSSSGCNAVVRSNRVNWSTPLNAPLRLIPNIGEEGTIMRLVNLNPDNEYQIYGYNEAGKLVQMQSVSGHATTEIRAEGNQGIYMLRVVTDEKVETLRYIIK